MPPSRRRTPAKRQPVRRVAAPRQPDWAELPDKELLQLRICDLNLRIEGSLLEERIARLYRELEYRRLKFRPHFWLSDEWFAPDGVPGIAIPFYLAHPRLMRLEGRQMLEIEGGPAWWCLKILRHETGHAIDTAFQIHRRKAYRESFGEYRDKYPSTYKPKPFSKNYVLHLDYWYAQAHPAEDFAETFAVWLKPRSRWRNEYEHWPAALRKLELVDRMMADIRAEKPKIATKTFVDPLRSIRKTLAEHYRAKQKLYGEAHPEFHDSDLRRLFSSAQEHSHRPAAAAMLKHFRASLRRNVSHWTGEYQYTIDQVLGEMIKRCRDLNLRVHHSLAQSKRDVLALLTSQTMNYLHAGHHRLPL